MPNRDIHNLICTLSGIDGKKANYVNKMMDMPSQIYGSNHRKLFHGQHIYSAKTPIGTIQVSKFRLEPKDLIEIYALTGFDKDAMSAWLLHVIADGVSGTSIRTYPKKRK